MRAIRGLASLFAVAALFSFPPLAFGDETWKPTDQEMAAMGGPLEALTVLRQQLYAGEINLCNFVGDLVARKQDFVSATGRAVTIRCEGADNPYVLEYAPHSAFALDATSKNDRLMFCQTNNGSAMYGLARKKGEITCWGSSGQHGIYKREVVRRFVTAWTILSLGGAFRPPEEAAVREQFKDAQPLTADQQESLRKTQIQVELAIKENQLLDAAQLYRTALTATPAWSGGQFNDALLTADLEFYPSAILHMRIYLALSPDAPDARAARDKIYEWEARLPRPAQ